MTPIDADPLEGLLRQALASTPTAAPATDPLGDLDRRVRRARRRLAAGAGVVAAVVAAAIVVPLTVGVGGGGQPNGVSVVGPATQSPEPTPPPGTNVLWASGAVSVSAASDGTSWLLYSDGGQSFVTQVSGSKEKSVAVQPPADYIVAADNRVWVIGQGPGGSAPSRLSAVDMRTGTVSSVTFGQQLSLATAVNDSLYVDALDASTNQDSVDRVDLSNGAIAITGSVRVPAAGAIAASQQGHVWVQSASGLVELIPTANGVQKGVTVGWSGDVYGPTGADSMGSDSLWAFDGDRLIGLTPKFLLQGASVAQGWRLNVAGKPEAVVTAKDGGLFVYAPQQSAFGHQAGLAAGIDYLSSQDVRGSGTSHTASLLGVRVLTMAADPVAGIDYVNDQGQLIRWDPTCQDAQATTCR